jgi:hypothetical protein
VPVVSFRARFVCGRSRVFKKPWFLEDRRVEVESGLSVVKKSFKNPAIQQRRRHRFLTRFPA